MIMRNWVFFIFTWIIFSSAHVENSYNLEVVVNGIVSKEGTVHIAIYRSQDAFPVYGKQFKGQIIQVKGNTASASFTSLKIGLYAIAVFHDKNNNSKLDKNVFGVPTESYGFSNNARSTFSAPTFSAASIDLKRDIEVKISIR